MCQDRGFRDTLSCEKTITQIICVYYMYLAGGTCIHNCIIYNYYNIIIGIANLKLYQS